jgi:hypothetical protein
MFIPTNNLKTFLDILFGRIYTIENPRKTKVGDIVEFVETSNPRGTQREKIPKYLRKQKALITLRYKKILYDYSPPYIRRYFECLVLTGKEQGKSKSFFIENLPLKNLRVLSEKEINGLSDDIRFVCERKRISKQSIWKES